MFDWLHVLGRRLGYFIVHVPLYVAGPAMIVIGALDSSLLSLPEVNDYLVVARCFAHPRTVFFFPLFAATGSLLGCLLLYTILRRGGQAVLHRRFRIDHVQRVERAYARFGILALAVPALLPPPMPFKIFVATAGALQFPRRRFLVTILLARSLRYYVEGTLAVFYGERVVRFLKDNGIIIISVVTGICLIALATYLLSGKGRAAVKVGKETR
ncbi:MAG TPA: VTT domain-containing protein [Pyrinomonadaceae bacterium]|jgi:membrane protein YqaA with SNARE-associated domain|nr:VTT domain-containing protein [Pyrinomonadaceae bacterium]